MNLQSLFPLLPAGWVVLHAGDVFEVPPELTIPAVLERLKSKGFAVSQSDLDNILFEDYGIMYYRAQTANIAGGIDAMIERDEKIIQNGQYMGYGWILREWQFPDAAFQGWMRRNVFYDLKALLIAGPEGVRKEVERCKRRFIDGRPRQ